MLRDDKPLRIHDTLSREKRDFKPLDPKNVRMYVCGPTVYDFAHVGNARPVVIFDVLYRLLRHRYGVEHVKYVRNITDIDDKIIDAAKASGEPIDAITARTTQAYHNDMAALGALPPDEEPRCTQTIPEMVAMIEILIAKGHAYEAEGHVLFDVPSWPEYGGLSRNKRDDIVAGARVEVAPYKKDPADFILWKPSTADQPGWDSPWGRGRPGWHIECSAMAEKHLGPDFDIHGGGQDLIFPHHENEIAQSLCADPGHKFAKYWMHNGYLMAEGEKMSKSLGNFYTVHDLLDEFPGEAIRLLLLKTHYRQPLDFTKKGIAEAKADLDRMYGALRFIGVTAARADDDPPTLVVEALVDDLNTSQALTEIHALVNRVYQAIDKGEKPPAAEKDIKAAGLLLGILQQDPEVWFKGDASEGAGEIDDLIARREAARAAKDFGRADAIRDELAAQGIVLEDNEDGTTDWRRATVVTTKEGDIVVAGDSEEIVVITDEKSSE